MLTNLADGVLPPISNSKLKLLTLVPLLKEDFLEKLGRDTNDELNEDDAEFINKGRESHN